VTAFETVVPTGVVFPPIVVVAAAAAAAVAVVVLTLLDWTGTRTYPGGGCGI